MRWTDKPTLLDLFCGAGGAAVGYHRAGFDIVGVDIRSQPRYPFHFFKMDALDFAADYGRWFDVIHASPPCQRYSSITKTSGRSSKHLDLIEPTRAILKSVGKPYVIENVPGARKKLINPLMLEGTMFNLLVVRQRYFETNPSIWFAPAMPNRQRKVVKHGRKPDREKHYAAVTGHFSDVEFVQQAMGINWMTQKELSQAIPPTYTEYLGKQLLKQISS